MPVHKTRKRYIAFKIIDDLFFSKKEIGEAVIKSKQKILSVSNDFFFRIIAYYPLKHLVIIKCNHDYVDVCKKILNRMKIAGKSVNIKIIMVSGTLKSLRNKIGLKKRQKES